MDQQIEYVLFEPKTKRWLAIKGFVSQKKYAKRYTEKVQAEAVQKHLYKHKVDTEIQEIEAE